MNILLINPPYRYSKEITSGEVNPPLGLMYIASYCQKKGHNVELLDAIVEAPDQIIKFQDMYYRGLTFKEISKKIKKDTELIGITNLFSSSYPIIRELINHIKKRHNIPIAIGGANASALPRYILKDSKADFVIISEGEETFNDLCKALKEKKKFKDIDGFAYKKKNKIYVNPKKKFIKDLDKLPFPNRELAHPKRYSKYKEAHAGTEYMWTSILSSRGCPFNCSFCTSALWKRKYRARSPKNVVDEIEYCVKKYGVKEFLFEDENLTLDKERIIKICDEIIKRKLNIVWQPANGIRASVTDREVLEKMKESGCHYIVVAPESGSDRVLNEIIHKEQELDKVSSVIKDAVALGFKVGSYFVIGFPGEKIEEVNQTINYANKLARYGVDECVYSPFFPLPGSPLFNDLLNKKELVVNDTYFKQIFTAADILSKPKSWSKHIPDKKLRQLKLKGYLLFHTNRAIFHPLATIKSLINTLINKHELKTEQSLRMLIKRYLSV